MTTNVNNVDFDALVRQARIERSLVIGNAVASIVVAASNGIERAVRAIARLSDRPTPARSTRAA